VALIGALCLAAGSVGTAQAAPVPAEAPDLWRGARAGMDVDGVRGLFPGARPVAGGAILTGGEVERLDLPGLELGGRPAVARFYFDGAALAAVELTVSGLTHQPAANEALAQAVAAQYSGLYGAGYDCGDRSLGDVSVYECKWLAGPVRVRLWYMDVAGQAPMLVLGYRKVDSPGYDL
jgi:hypothetical protein